jgi:4-amino-4-deoxy-L-arabinose transferase-like glycosyltransferase
MTERRLLYVILASYMLIAAIYSIITPIFEVSDELWHYPMVKYLADNGLCLPPQDPANPGPWRQEGSQPPLYYLLSAILTAGIDTSDMDVVRRINPHADIGVIRPDGNANMIVHRTEQEGFPWRGTVLAVHVIRCFSIALGLATLLVTYQLAREIFPEQPVIALGAAALNAFLPMFVFISASVNNDNLSNLLGNLLTLLIVRLLKTTDRPRGRVYVVLGVVCGAGLLAKLNLVFLIPLVALALLVVSLRLRDWRPLVMGGGIVAALTVAIAGWWYVRNAQLYGDPTGINMFLNMVGRRAIPANAAQLWSERHSFTQAYWGFFGGVNVPLPEVVYLLFNIIGGVGLIGALALIGYRMLHHIRMGVLNIPQATPPLHAMERRPGGEDWNWLPASITLIWPLVTFISYLRWTAETPASQGRLVFGALSAISLWLAVGLVALLPNRVRPFMAAGAAVYFALVTTLTPFLVITPAYALPAILPAQTVNSPFAEPGGGEIGLVADSVQVLTPTVRPEEYARVQMDWQIGQPLSQDWSLFVHLVTPDGVIVSQRDVYPGGGKLATGDLSPNAAWQNPVAVWIPPAAYAPSRLDVKVGWYHLPSGERMKLPDGQEMLTLGIVDLQPRADDLNVPNPMRVNFDNQIELVGYSLSTLAPKAGDTVELMLYWRGRRKIERDYVVFAHIIEPRTQAIYAGSDAMPVQWGAPTSTWGIGTIIKDTHKLTVKPETPPGIYELEIGLYLQEQDGSFPRLRIVTPDGGMADNYTYLSRVRVLP